VANSRAMAYLRGIYFIPTPRKTPILGVYRPRSDLLQHLLRLVASDRISPAHHRDGYSVRLRRAVRGYSVRSSSLMWHAAAFIVHADAEVGHSLATHSSMFRNRIDCLANAGRPRRRLPAAAARPAPRAARSRSTSSKLSPASRTLRCPERSSNASTSNLAPRDSSTNPEDN